MVISSGWYFVAVSVVPFFTAPRKQRGSHVVTVSSEIPEIKPKATE